MAPRHRLSPVIGCRSMIKRKIHEVGRFRPLFGLEIRPGMAVDSTEMRPAPTCGIEDLP